MRSLDEVRDRVKLTSNQKIGMQYFDEFDERMEREEVTRIENVVSTLLFFSGIRSEGKPGIFTSCDSQMFAR